MAASQSIVLVTGGNGGIGYELVRQLLSDPAKHVLLGSRSAEKGEAAVKVLKSQKQPGTVELLQLDVSSEESIKAAAKSLESKHGRLDALVNNAAVAIFPEDMPFTQQMAAAYATNSTGPWLTVEYFAPLLRKSKTTPRIINVSTGMGSMELRLKPEMIAYNLQAVQYRSSKAALNMVTYCQAVEYGSLGWKVFAFCPGFTESNLGPNNNAANGAKPTSEGAAPMVNILNGDRDADHAKFVHDFDGYYPW